MASTIKGITVKIAGETTGLAKSVEEYTILFTLIASGIENY